MAQNTLISFDNLQAVLNEYGKEVTRLYRANLEEPRLVGDIITNRVASGDLVNSINFNLEVKGRSYNVVLSMLEYWKYIESGRPSGGYPPTDKLLEWIRIKPVIPRPDKNTGRIPTPQQLAYLIGRKIHEDGYEGSHELERANDTTLKRFEPKIVAALAKDLGTYMQKFVIEKVL